MVFLEAPPNGGALLFTGQCAASSTKQANEEKKQSF